MKELLSINPASGELNRELELYSNEKVNEAVKKAQHAFLDWKKLDIADRAEHIKNAAKVLRKKKQELGELITMEMGKTITESISEVEKCAWTLDYFADNAEQFLDEELVETDAQTSFVAFEPLGIVLSIMPWNFPFWQALRFGAPALAGGNVILLKHSSSVPLCALAIENVFAEAGLPEGVYQTLLIDGAAASSLISRDEIRAVTFTGSVSAGQRVAVAAAKNMKKFVLELGGSDPFIVLKDADIEEAAKVAVTSRFLNSGQSCIAAKRFIVEQSVSEQFTSKFVEFARALKVGDPMDENTDIGPLVRKEQVTLIEEQVRDATAKGATVLLKGGNMGGKGFFYSPVILTNLTDDMKVVTEETFGPVAPIITVADEEEAVRVANNTEFGLGASIWSKDKDKALRLAGKLQVGTVAINSLVRSDPRLPFGGTKKSGIGRELSKYGLYEFMNIKSISVF